MQSSFDVVAGVATAKHGQGQVERVCQEKLATRRMAGEGNATRFRNEKMIHALHSVADDAADADYVQYLPNLEPVDVVPNIFHPLRQLLHG